MRDSLTAEFSDRIEGVFGPAGVEWLARLPRLLESAASRWSIELQPPFQPLSYNYVVPAIKADGEAVVLKAGVPNKALATEIDALRHFDGQGAVQLIEADADAGLLLLERLSPGVPVKAMGDDGNATSIFARIAHRLWRPPPEHHDFSTVSDWAKGFTRLRERFNGKAGPFPEETIGHAERVMSELVDSMSDVVVLHGDLHHWNILSAEREPWLAIDPKGVIGEPAYEVGAWLRNPFPRILREPNFEQLTLRRVELLADELGFDGSRLLGWGFCQSVLSAVWSFEDGEDDWAEGLELAGRFAALQ